jgi:hypothetical protein
LKIGITKNSEGSYRNLDARAATGVGANRAGGQPAFVLKARSGATLPGILGAQLATNRLLIEASQRLPAQSRNHSFCSLVAAPKSSSDYANAPHAPVQRGDVFYLRHFTGVPKSSDPTKAQGPKLRPCY